MDYTPKPIDTSWVELRQDLPTVRALAVYYRQKRLSYQQDFFARRSRQYQGRARLMQPPVPLTLFGMSVCAVFVHVMAELVADH